MKDNKNNKNTNNNKQEARFMHGIAALTFILTSSSYDILRGSACGDINWRRKNEYRRLVVCWQVEVLVSVFSQAKPEAVKRNLLAESSHCSGSFQVFAYHFDGGQLRQYYPSCLWSGVWVKKTCFMHIMIGLASKRERRVS